MATTEMQNQIKAILYCRVSSKEQEETGYSLDAQEKLLKEYAEKKGLVLNLNVDSGDYSMTGDTLQLGEVIRNLIDNSINYTLKGSIDVFLSNSDQFIKVKVKDTGIGLFSEDMPKIFRSGVRGADSLKVNVNSTGYGLAFVKGVVEAHKGRVWAESEGTGKGSTFFIELPKTQ